MRKRNARLNAIEQQDNITKQIKKFLKKEGCTVYGARSINAQSNILTRSTNDWDAYSNTPEKTAKQLQRQLDKLVGGDYFYHKPAMHKCTWKVKTIGDDLIRDTLDDEDIADFSKPDKKVKIKIIDGLRYRDLREEIKAKQKAIADPEFKFRHEKDQRDLDRIKANIKIKRLMQ